MKALLKLRVLCIFIFQAWAQGYPVKMECNLLNLTVSVKRDLFNDGISVRASDLILGDGCPVNNVLVHEYKFQYSVRECGITTKVYATRLIFKTVVYYNPESYGLEFCHSKTEFHVSCSVDRIVSPQYSLTSPGEDPQSSEAASQASIRGPMFSTPEFHFFSSE